ncbi:MAG: hypothetical protein JSV84_11985 [Gemmatimonadota bacterium]|nr:MAG: hypothetical protein JSV84_11985 [Gemmatimonadota bacterium]
MRIVLSVYHLMRADFLERVRRYSFLIVLGVTVYAGYAMVPPIDALYNAFVVGGQRGVYNSAWVGTVFGVVVSTLLVLIGFYLIRNAVNRDYETRVGQIIATTPIRKPVYVFGKWLSNLAVLTSILVILTVMALIMQIVRAEDTNIDLWALIAPIWFIGFPTLAIVSAVAVLFETLPLLRRGIGQAVYLCLFTWYIAQPFLSPETLVPSNDFSGISRTMVDIRELLESKGVDINQGTTDLFEPTGGREVVRFVWDGLVWTADIILERLMWFGLAVAIVLAAALPFDRFDPARRHLRLRKRRKKPKRKRRKQETDFEATLLVTNELVSSHVPNVDVQLTPLDEKSMHGRFWNMVLTEFLLIARGRKWWWYMVTVGLIIANLASPLEVCRRWLIPAAWIWPIFLWSSMGNYEKRYQTQQIVFSTARLVRRQLPAIWLAGVLVTVIATSGNGLRWLFVGQWNHLGAWAVGILFVPSLALTLGVWTNGGRLFEMVYFIVWYLGAFKAVKFLNYIGSTEASVRSGIPLYYLGITVLLILFAVIGRKRQIHK